MKNIRKIFLFLAIICTLITFYGCNDLSSNNKDKQIELTETEIIAKTKNHLISKFSNTKIYTDISLPNYYSVESKYDVYITWQSSDSKTINPTSGKVNRTLFNQDCTLTANILYKSNKDSIEFYLTIPANTYTDNTNGFPKKQLVEAKISYMEISQNLKIKLKIANNSKSSEVMYGITNMTFSIKYQGYKFLVKNLVYNNANPKQFILNPNCCIEIELPTISSSSLYTNYLIDSTYTCTISSLSYYNSRGSLTQVGF